MLSQPCTPEETTCLCYVTDRCLGCANGKAKLAVNNVNQGETKYEALHTAKLLRAKAVAAWAHQSLATEQDFGVG